MKKLLIHLCIGAVDDQLALIILRMKIWKLINLLFAFTFFILETHASDSLYKANIDNTEIGEVPDDFLVLDGDFSVKQENGNKFIELPGSPLDSFGIMFGPSASQGNEISARIYGTKKGRRYPVFGVAMNGVNGYRLQITPAKRSIELLKGKNVIAETAFRWTSGSWLKLSLSITKTKESEWTITGKVWEDEKIKPTKTTLSFKETKEPRKGKPSIWGSPYSDTPIRYDDIFINKTVD